MPEGHTLHRLAQDLTSTFAGRPIRSSSPQGRFAAGAAHLDGLAFADADAFGKHLLVGFDQLSAVVHVHLGLYGSFTISEPNHPITGQVRWRLQDDRATADLRGPAVCELLAPPEVTQLLERLGPDPLRDDADPDRAWQRIQRSSQPIASLLMDQKVISGIGNVYRAELLFRHGVPPMMAGRRLPRVRWNAMWADLVDLMNIGVQRNRIDTVRAEHEAEAMGRPPREDDHGGEVYVYRRDGQRCFVCDSIIRTKPLAGRNLFWCPTCQTGRSPHRAR